MCDQRFKLSQAVSDAVRVTYQAKGFLEITRNAKADIGAQSSALAVARVTERRAVSALREHIETHGCKE